MTVELTSRLSAWIERVAKLRAFGWRPLAGLDRAALGRRGERIAERYLRQRGYVILERNFRGAGAEIDLVAMDSGTLAFVEVKTRRTKLYGEPHEAVTVNKQRHLRRAAEVFAARRRMQDAPMRFDVVAISEDEQGRRLELLKDAF